MVATRYRRDWSLTARRLACASGLLLLEAGLVAAGVCLMNHPASFGAFRDEVELALIAALAFVGMAALAFLCLAVGASGAATCPACAAPIGDLASGDLEVACASCHAYLFGREGELTVVPADHVASTALFSTKMPGQVVWPVRPDGALACCVCGESARLVPVAWKAQSPHTPGSARVDTVDRTTDVPHCSAHADGAAFGHFVGGDVTVKFRSLAYLRAFCAANALVPGA